MRSDFVAMGNAAGASLGLPPEMPMMLVPDKIMVPIPESERRGEIEGAMGKLVDALTKWQPKVTAKGVSYPKPETLTIEGRDYNEALDAMNRAYLKNNWDDGLPLMPPTAERVKFLLTGTDLPPDYLIGKIPTAGGYFTVKVLAINAAMAGARPEYMPVLIAAFEAMLKPVWHLEGLVTTGNPTAPLLILNGPIAKQIRVSSGYGLLGPDPLHPAGASIGRTIRLVIQNVGGVLPGVTGRSTQGQPGRYTGLVVAENEDNTPWTLLSETRGFAKGANVVTAISVSGTQDAFATIPPKKLMSEGGDRVFLDELSVYLTEPYPNYFIVDTDERGASYAGVLLVGPMHARELAKVGWSKEKVSAYLYENARVPVSVQERLKDAGVSTWMPVYWAKEWPGKEPLPIIDRPEGFLIVVAGGELQRTAWLPIGHGGKVAQTVEIKLPKDWDKLIKQSETDLGPIPAQ